MIYNLPVRASDDIVLPCRVMKTGAVIRTLEMDCQTSIIQRVVKDEINISVTIISNAYLHSTITGHKVTALTKGKTMSLIFTQVLMSYKTKTS